MQKFAINGQLGQMIAFNIMQAIRQGHVAKFMVMAVGFSVGRNTDDLGIGITRAKIIRQAPGKLFTIIKQAFKSNSQGNRPIIKENSKFAGPTADNSDKARADQPWPQPHPATAFPDRPA